MMDQPAALARRFYLLDRASALARRFYLLDSASALAPFIYLRNQAFIRRRRTHLSAAAPVYTGLGYELSLIAS